MIFKESKTNDIEAMKYLTTLNAEHVNALTIKLESMFNAGIKTPEDVYTTAALLTEYKNITGNEYKYIMEDSII
jgi:hypothetical protein